MKRYIIILILVNMSLLGTQTGRAQLIPVLGSQRAGTAMAQFLKIGVGGRAMGMGESFVAVSNDASSLYWNPAGITQMDEREAIFAHTEWLVDIQHEFLGYVHPLGSFGTLGFSVTSLHTDDIEETTEFQPFGTGNYVSFGDIAAGVTYARNMTDRFSVGITAKFIDETIAEFHARNVLIDLGTFYWTGYKSTRFAIAITNFGTNMQLSSENETSRMTFDKDGSPINEIVSDSTFQDFQPPIVFRLGFATEVVDNETHKMTTSIQLNHPNDNAENLNFGAEYWWNSVMALRGGYRFNVDEESYTFGAGLAVPANFANFRLDFSYTHFGRLGSAIRFSTNLSF